MRRMSACLANAPIVVGAPNSGGIAGNCKQASCALNACSNFVLSGYSIVLMALPIQHTGYFDNTCMCFFRLLVLVGLFLSSASRVTFFSFLQVAL